jgi:hypothetical protein
MFLLRRRADEARISRRILRLEDSDALEVSRIGHHRRDLFDLFELVRIRIRIHKSGFSVDVFTPAVSLSSSRG